MKERLYAYFIRSLELNNAFGYTLITLHYFYEVAAGFQAGAYWLGFTRHHVMALHYTAQVIHHLQHHTGFHISALSLYIKHMRAWVREHTHLQH